MAKDCGCSKNAAGHLHAHPEYRHAIPALNWMMPCHPLFVPNQPPPPPPPCGCHHHMPLPHPGPVDYLPSRLYPDFWSDAHWMIPFPHLHHHHHGYWHGPFLPVPPPPPYPHHHHHPEQPVKPEPSGCTPRIYRKPTVVIDAGSNIKVSSIETVDGTTSYIISAPNMTGATSKTNGKGGAVPAPMASDYGKFLSADGTWKYIKTNIVFDSEIFKGDGTESSPLYIDDMIPASDKKSGVSGLVPAPQAGEENSFLKGNGKWAKINVPKSVLDLDDAAEYLKTVDADSKYASKEWIGEHYLEQSAADDKFLTKKSAANTYLAQDDAKDTYIDKDAIDNDLIVVKDEKVTVNVTTVGNTVTRIGNYYVSGSAVPSEKIFDNDDDGEQGKLWLYEDGTLTIDLDYKVSEIELYYSSKGTSQIQYYKIMTELLDAPKSNVGMFTTFKANESPLLYSFEQVNVGYTSSETGSTIVITSLAGTDSEVKIERVYGSKE